MKTLRLRSRFLTRLLLLTAVAAMAPLASAQITNWVAYNNYRSGPIVPPHVPTPNSWGTARNVTTIDMGDPGNVSGPLTNFLTGNPLTATLTVARTGSADNFGALGRPMPTNTPMARLFLGICDLSADGLIGVRTNATDHRFVTLTFGGLDPAKRYVFRGTTARNGGYGNRWSVATIAADGWTDAHINGAGGPGVLTANNFPAGALSPGQAAWNSGANPEGAVVGWNDIAPFPDGTFTITGDQYTGALPGGIANSGPYGYSFTAMMLAEVEIVAPTITASPTASTTVEQNRPFSLSVAATGAPLNYQWYKEDAGEISGATFATYSVGQAQVSDSGVYFAVVYNALASRTTTVAQVTVFADTNAPSVETIFSYPTVDFNGVATLDQIVIEFNEAVLPDSVSFAASYVVPGGGNPVSVTLTNERTVVLALASPLAENTDYSVTINGVEDIVNNVAGTFTAPFHSWVSGIGNGLLMESFNVEDPAITVESLLADPDYPNNPDRRDSLRAFDSRLVYPDDTREGYGARIRGVFIPPVSGNWVFFARTRQLGVVNLNPNGTAEAGKVEILRQSTENAPFNWDRLSSSLYSLHAGRGYFIEGLYKGAVGPDYLKVAARLAGTGVPTPVDTPNTEVDTNSLAGGFIGFPLAPRDLGGPLTIVQQPADISTEDNHIVTFAVQVTNPSGLPVFYQWSRDGNPIDGATGPSYSFQATTADSGAAFSVQVAKIGSVVTSRTATLSVVPDITPPGVLEVRGSLNLSNVVIKFNELVDPTQARETFNYAVGSFAVTSATLAADGSTVTLQLDNPLSPDTTYPVHVLYMKDLAGNETPASIDLTLRSFVTSCGFAARELYFNIGAGVLVNDLLGAATFPNSPDRREYTRLLEGPIENPPSTTADNFDNYGERISGFLLPPLSGDYYFFISSDDAGEFWLSTDDNPANKVLICQETSWNASRMWTGDRAGGTRGDPPSNISASPVPLVAGQKYYFEALHKEGAGGDNLAVAWQLPGASVPADGSSPIPGGFMAALADPVGAVLNITSQPANANVPTANTPASFSVGASSTINGQANTLLAYQWYRNDGAGWQTILGADQATYSLTTASADNSAQFRCNVYIPGNTATSQVATLTIGGGGVQPPAIGGGGAPPPSYNIGNSTFGLSFATQSGVSYTVQFKNSLSDPTWTNLPNMPIAGTGGVLAVSDSTAGQRTRFYRVAAQ